MNFTHDARRSPDVFCLIKEGNLRLWDCCGPINTQVSVFSRDNVVQKPSRLSLAMPMMFRNALWMTQSEFGIDKIFLTASRKRLSPRNFPYLQSDRLHVSSESVKYALRVRSFLQDDKRYCIRNIGAKKYSSQMPTKSILQAI